MKEIVCRETAAGIFEPVPTRSQKRKAKLNEAAKQKRKDDILAAALLGGAFLLWLVGSLFSAGLL